MKVNNVNEEKLKEIKGKINLSKFAPYAVAVGLIVSLGASNYSSYNAGVNHGYTDGYIEGSDTVWEEANEIITDLEKEIVDNQYENIIERTAKAKATAYKSQDDWFEFAEEAVIDAETDTIYYLDDMNYNTGMITEILYGDVDLTLTNAEVQYKDAAEKECEEYLNSMSDETKQLILEDYGVETFDEVLQEVKDDYILSFMNTLQDAQSNYFSLAEQIKEDKNITHEEGDTLLIHVNEDVILKGSDDYYFVKTGNTTVDENGKTVEEYLQVYGSYYADCFDFAYKVSFTNNSSFSNCNVAYYKEDSVEYSDLHRYVTYDKYLVNYEKLLDNASYSDLVESGITVYDATSDIETRNSDNWTYTENYDSEKGTNVIYIADGDELIGYTLAKDVCQNASNIYYNKTERIKNNTMEVARTN